MRKGITLTAVLTVILSLSVFAQEKKTASPNSTAVHLDRIISQNYISIRDLRTPIINYGGGQPQFDKVLEGFSAAFAKYLSERYDEAAVLFEKNEKEISDTAAQIARKYQKDTDELYSQLITVALKDRMGKSINRTNIETEMDLTSPNDFYLKNAAHLMKIADQRLAEGNPIESIFYYRKSKQYIFQSYNEIGIKPDKKFARDIADMRGEVFIAEASREKDK